MELEDNQTEESSLYEESNIKDASDNDIDPFGDQRSKCAGI